MKQPTHAWIAIRAVDLLDHDDDTKGLAELLKPHVHKAAIGAWMPDKQDAKLGGSWTGNHVFKMAPYKSAYVADRFVTKKKDLLKRLGPARLVSKFIQDWGDSVLDAKWWTTPYKADPPPGKHLPNRAMSISVSLIDLLILGNDQVAAHVPRDIDFIDELVDAERSTEEMVALWFFYMSHFLADACMPCHCDERRLSSYTGGRLHKQLELHWNALVGSQFSDDNILSGAMTAAECLDMARNVDETIDVHFEDKIPKIPRAKDPKTKKSHAKDIWYDVVDVCRASFTLASIVAPPDSYSYGGKSRPKYKDLFGGTDGQELLDDLDRAVLHDAVLNTAIAWKHIWMKF